MAGSIFTDTIFICLVPTSLVHHNWYCLSPSSITNPRTVLGLPQPFPLVFVLLTLSLVMNHVWGYDLTISSVDFSEQTAQLPVFLFYSVTAVQCVLTVQKIVQQSANFFIARLLATNHCVSQVLILHLSSHESIRPNDDTHIAGLKTHLFNQANSVLWEHFILRVYCTYLLTYLLEAILNVCTSLG